MKKKEILQEYIDLKKAIRLMTNEDSELSTMGKILDFQTKSEIPLLSAKLELFLEIKVSEIKIMKEITDLKYKMFPLEL